MFEVYVKNMMEERGGDQARFFMWIHCTLCIQCSLSMNMGAHVSIRPINIHGL